MSRSIDASSLATRPWPTCLATREQLLGESFLLLYPSNDEFERTGQRLVPILNATGYYSDERIMKRANQELFWCHVSGRALEPADPHAGGIWIFEDLSAKRSVSPEMSARERKLLRSSSMAKPAS